MRGVEVLALLNAGSTRYHPASGGSPLAGELNRIELAGLLAGLPTHCVDYAMAAVAGDVDSERRLVAHVRVWLAGVAGERGWRTQRGRPTIMNMAAVAVFEAVRPNRCGGCGGVGWHEAGRECRQCAGTGYKHLSGRKVAEAIGVDHVNYLRNWRGRYEEAFRYVYGIEYQVKRAVYSALVSG